MTKSLPNQPGFADASRCALLQITCLFMWYRVSQINDDVDHFKPVISAISALYAYVCLESWCGTQLVLSPVITVMWYLQTWVLVALTSIQIPVLSLPFFLMYVLDLHRALEKVRHGECDTCLAKLPIPKILVTFYDGCSLCHSFSSISDVTSSEESNTSMRHSFKYDQEHIHFLLMQQKGMKAELLAYFGGGDCDGDTCSTSSDMTKSESSEDYAISMDPGRSEEIEYDQEHIHFLLMQQKGMKAELLAYFGGGDCDGDTCSTSSGRTKSESSVDSIISMDWERLEEI